MIDCYGIRMVDKNMEKLVREQRFMLESKKE